MMHFFNIDTIQIEDLIVIYFLLYGFKIAPFYKNRYGILRKL